MTTAVWFPGAETHLFPPPEHRKSSQSVFGFLDDPIE